MCKDMFEEIGITKKEIREFCEAIEKLARNKTVTDNFYRVDPVLRKLQEIAELKGYEIELDYGDLSVIITLKIDTVGVFVKGEISTLTDAMEQVDSVVIEFDDMDEDTISIDFIIKDIFKLPGEDEQR